MEVKKGLNKLARRLGIEFNHKELVNDLYRLVGENLYHAEGAQGEVVANWKAKLEGRVVCFPLDKRKQV